MKKKVFYLLAPFLLIVIFYVWIYWIWRYYNANTLFHGIVGAVIGAIFTFILVIAAWKQLGDISRTSSADFIHKLKKDFFTPEARTLIHLISRGWIRFVNKGEKIYFFTIDEDKIKTSSLPCGITHKLTQEKTYSSFEMDDILLGHFEDVGFLEEQGLVDIEMVENQFSWYIGVVFENPEIQAYIKSQREEISSDIYENLEYIYKKCKSYEKAKKANKSITLWKIRYRICPR